MNVLTLFLSWTLLAAGPGAPGAEAKLKIAVMDLRGSQAIPAELVQSLTALVPEELDKLGTFKALSTSDINQMLAFEALKDRMGCDDVSCLAELGGALGVDYVVSGSITLVGDTYLVQLQLLNIKQARVDGRVAREYKGGPVGLLDEIRTATKFVVRELQASRSGELAVTVSEEGATVRLDGSIVGASPMPHLTTGSGIHTLTVDKEGFVRFTRDVVVAAKTRTDLDVRLTPSQEYLRAYAERAGSTRTMAWAGLVTGGAGLIAAGAVYGLSAGKASSLSDKIKTYNSQSTHTTAQYDDLVSQRKSLATLNLVSLVAAAVGAGGVGLGSFLWLKGPDPHAYDTVISAGPGHAGLSLQGSF